MIATRRQYDEISDDLKIFQLILLFLQPFMVDILQFYICEMIPFVLLPWTNDSFSSMAHAHTVHTNDSITIRQHSRVLGLLNDMHGTGKWLKVLETSKFGGPHWRQERKGVFKGI